METTIDSNDIIIHFDVNGTTKRYFDERGALALLLLNEVLIMNCNHWYQEWPKKARQTFAFAVNCGDVFSYACADATELLENELEDLFDHWFMDCTYGHIVWCIKKEGRLPVREIYTQIQSRRIWNLDEMNLQPNYHWK